MDPPQAARAAKWRWQSGKGEVVLAMCLDPTDQALNVCWNQPTGKQCRGLNVGELQSDDINIKPAGNFGVFDRKMGLIKMHGLCHELTGIEQLARGDLTTATPSINQMMKRE